VDEVFRICPKCGMRRVRFVAGIGTLTPTLSHRMGEGVNKQQANKFHVAPRST
jgi:hypothetical protein